MWAYAYILTDKLLKKFPIYNNPNIFLHGPLTSEATRVVPYPTPHALTSSCVYDVHKQPLRIKSIIPDSVYWSISFHARNQDCFFTLNDLEATQKYGKNINIVLKKPGLNYKAKKDEIVLSTPSLSKKGLILIRIIIINPNDKDTIRKVRRKQKKVVSELLEFD